MLLNKLLFKKKKIPTHTRIPTNTHTHTHTYIHIPTHTHTHTHTHKHRHIPTHTNTHTHNTQWDETLASAVGRRWRATKAKLRPSTTL